MGCKESAIINYPIDDVFAIFAKAAKRDFPDFSEDNAVGCKISKTLRNFNNAAKCTIEITQYIKNEKYQVTTTTDNSICISTYTFTKKKDNTTMIKLEEEQTTKNFMSYLTLIIQRMLAKKQFKEGFNAFVESLNVELKHKYDNIERNKGNK